MLDRVGEENVEEKDLISKHFPKITVEAPGYTPWSECFANLMDIDILTKSDCLGCDSLWRFDTWMKLYLASLPTVDHEYLKHHLGCIFAVSTTTKYVSKVPQNIPKYFPKLLLHPQLPQRKTKEKWKNEPQMYVGKNFKLRIRLAHVRRPLSQGSSWCFEIPDIYATESAAWANWSECLPSIFCPKHSKVRRFII